MSNHKCHMPDEKESRLKSSNLASITESEYQQYIKSIQELEKIIIEAEKSYNQIEEMRKQIERLAIQNYATNAIKSVKTRLSRKSKFASKNFKRLRMG